MKKAFRSFLFFLFLAGSLQAQDIVTRKDGDYLRGIIKGCDAYTVLMTDEQGNEKLLKVKDVKDFFWNGDTYVSKTFFDAKKPEERFAKVLESGAVNLYAIGGGPTTAPVQRSAVRARPSIGLGMGTGGLGGGVGGSISFGGRNAPEEQAAQAARIWYYIERPGKNGVQPIPFAIVTPEANKRAVKDILLFNLGDEPELAAKLQAASEFNRKDVLEFVKAYNQKKVSNP